MKSFHLPVLLLKWHTRQGYYDCTIVADMYVQYMHAVPSAYYYNLLNDYDITLFGDSSVLLQVTILLSQYGMAVITILLCWARVVIDLCS